MAALDQHTDCELSLWRLRFVRILDHGNPRGQHQKVRTYNISIASHP